MEALLVKAGLSRTQAALYLFLLETGQNTPPVIATKLGLTRSNAYKVLEGLEALGLVQKITTSKKIAYQAADPAALISLVAEERNRAIAVERTVNDVMQQLRAKYQKGTKHRQIVTGRGKEALIAAYEHQFEQRQPIHFIKSRADIPFLSFEVMDHLRRLPAKLGTRRFGITPIGPEVSPDPEADKRSNLVRTLILAEQYTAPVEWTVTDGELLILVFEDDGYYIRIQDKSVARAFVQLWRLMQAQART